MKQLRLLLTLSIVLSVNHFVKAQTASDVLEKGRRVQSKEKLFLFLNDKQLKSQIAEIEDFQNYKKIQDSFLLIPSEGINIFMKPLNPLNYEQSTETKIIIDPINAKASEDIKTIFSGIGTILVPNEKASRFNGPETPNNCNNYKKIDTTLIFIQKLLANDQKSSIVTAFSRLKALTFINEPMTKSEIDSVAISINSIEKHYARITTLLEETRNDINAYGKDCNKSGKNIVQFIFNEILEKLQIAKDEKYKRVKNLNAAFKIVREAQITATNGGGWNIQLGYISASDKNMALYSVIIKTGGYKLNDSNEIVASESKEIINQMFWMRKFQRFVPEGSVGIAFTFFKYNSYGTTSDSSGQQYVASPTEEVLQNLNISAMMNFNLYSPNSALHPLFQIGIGVNSGMPTFFTGLGLRVSLNSENRFRITGGLATTWLRELDTLEVGSKVTGTSDIEKDLKLSSAPIFSPYFGLQYNF